MSNTCPKQQQRSLPLSIARLILSKRRAAPRRAAPSNSNHPLSTGGAAAGIDEVAWRSSVAISSSLARVLDSCVWGGYLWPLVWQRFDELFLTRELGRGSVNLRSKNARSASQSIEARRRSCFISQSRKTPFTPSSVPRQSPQQHVASFSSFNFFLSLSLFFTFG